MRLVGFLIVLVAATVLTQAAAPPTQPSSDPVIRRLIEDLGSDTFAVREDASRKLLKRPEAAPALRHALHSTDREVVRRAKEILDVFASRHRGWLLEQMKADARAGRADLLAERLVHWPGADSEPGCWQPVFDLCREQLDRLPQQVRESMKQERFLPRSFDRFAATTKLQFLPRGKPNLVLKWKPTPIPIAFFARGENISCKESLHGSIVVALKIGQFHDLVGGFTLAGGSVKSNHVIGYQILIVDGDVNIRTAISSLIVARGKVRCEKMIRDTVILNGKGIEFGRSATMSNCVFRSAGAITRNEKTEWQKCEFSENDKTAISSIQSFELSHVGIDISEHKEGLRITGLSQESPFASTGLQIGDLIAQVDRVDVRTKAELRNAIRRVIAIGELFEYRIIRNGKSRNLQINVQR